MAKSLSGVVSSDKGNKTIVVSISLTKTHPLYRKRYSVDRKIMAHDEKDEARTGDKVVITESRPISANKRFVLTEITEKAAVKHEEPAVEEQK